MNDSSHLTREQLERQLVRALEHMSDAFYMIDADWNFTYLNRVAARLLRRDRKQLIGKPVWAEFPEAVDTDLYHHYRQAMASGESCHFEFFYPALNEWFEVNGYPSDQGLGVYFHAVTDRKLMEQRLLESDERFRLVAQATVDTIWDWDLTTGTVWWNEGMQTMFGYHPEELEPDGASWTSRIHPDDREATVGYITATIKDRSRSRWDHEYRFRRKGGDYALVSDRGFVIRDANGWGLRMVGGITDITQVRQVESRLRDAQRMESVGQLTGGMAHDFNNLLTVILGNADLLRESLSAQPRLQALATIIGEAAQKGADLTQRLLAFARRQALTPRATDVNELIPNLQSLLERTLGEHIELRFYPADPLWPALIDPVQFESALLNLCLNARDAMPRGGKLTIETSNIRLGDDYTGGIEELSPGNYVQVSVTDTGTGISPELLKRVFEPFFTTKQAGRGTGLGLSMVYGFLKQSGGHISLYSESGEGTSVKLYMPRCNDEPAPMVKSEPLRPQGGRETLLVVEDDNLVRGYVTGQLKAAGYQVVEARNGPEALAMLAGHPDIELLFTDVMMPGGMTGRELADAALKQYPGLPVLYTSGYTENAIVHNGRLDPGVQLLGKPYRKADLLRKIREVLDGQH
ncbi:PAS domain S-box protein [uncultured Marinobacter sp.]|uniref:hybrid sensor histidine kinase/response regulator n=1 Tax=uncultured Marinobacter sp. TaxID=187379 RepID=UPI0030D93BB8